MKHMFATTAIALSAILCVPAMAQQAPISPSAPNPSAPPAPEGPSTQRGSSSGPSMSAGSAMSSDSTMQQDTTKSTTPKKHSSARAKKPREQNASPVATPTAPSGPKGDSPDPVTKQ